MLLFFFQHIRESLTILSFLCINGVSWLDLQAQLVFCLVNAVFDAGIMLNAL